VLALTGDAEAARGEFEHGLIHTRDLHHPYSEGYFVGHAAMLFFMMRDAEACRDQAERTMQIGRDYGFPLWVAVGGMFHCWARAVHGDATAALEEVRRHLAIYDWVQVRVVAPLRLDLLSLIQEMTGDTKGALESIALAEATVRATGESWYAPELARRAGELIVKTGGSRADAESAFQRALKDARTQGLKLFAARAERNLAELSGNAAGPGAFANELAPS
jgi:predicted ATPase